jgi:hypothetical protein
LVDGKKTATPSGVRGRCRLCGEVDYLCDSHLMPAALYRLLRSKTVNPRDPLAITTRSTFQTSRQVSEYLLCVDCEDKFRRNGEEWVLRHCYREGEGFALRELMLKGQLLGDGPVAKFYSTKSNLHIDSGALTFFAASIFWRAAARDWQFLKSVPGNPIALGPYQESLRKYLLGQTSFPHSAAMWVWVSSYDKPSRVVTTPHSGRILNCHAHSFDIPGMRFDLFLGRRLPEFVRLLCVVNDPDRPILVSDAPDNILATQLDQFRQTTQLSKALQKKGKWSWSL